MSYIEKFLRDEKDPKGTDVEIDELEKIGRGTLSEIFLVKATIRGKLKTHPAFFVMKKYKQERHTAREMAMRAWKNYQRAKAAGLKVFPTYRISTTEGKILMTPGHGPHQTCIGTNVGTNMLLDFDLPQLPFINNFPALVTSVYSHGVKAAQADIRINPYDSLFFLVRQTAQHDVDFVIGDLDFVSKLSSPIVENLASGAQHLRDFVRMNVNREKQQEYLEEINHQLAHFASENGVA